MSTHSLPGFLFVPAVTFAQFDGNPMDSVSMQVNLVSGQNLWTHAQTVQYTEFVQSVFQTGVVPDDQAAVWEMLRSCNPWLNQVFPHRHSFNSEQQCLVLNNGTHLPHSGQVPDSASPEFVQYYSSYGRPASSKNHSRSGGVVRLKTRGPAVPLGGVETSDGMWGLNSIRGVADIDLMELEIMVRAGALSAVQGRVRVR